MPDLENPFQETLLSRHRAEPCTVVIFGATGDLSHRKILPSLYRRMLVGQMPAGSRLIGAGSYFVNAIGGCSDCHTNPPYAAGGDPYLGQPKKINAAAFLGGGVAFGPFISANITPDSAGRPAGLTLRQFINLMRTGKEPGEDGLLQVMPWPVYQSMTDCDLTAIYTYLQTVPRIRNSN